MKRTFPLYIIKVWCLLAMATGTATAQTAEWQLMHRGNAAFRAHNYDAAATLYREALHHNPHSARALFNLGDTYLAKGDARAADSLYLEASRLEKNAQVKSMAFHNRGYIRQKMALADRERQQQLLRDAIEQYKQALRLNPRDNDTRYNLALCQKQLKDSQQSQQQKKKDKQQQQKQPQQKQQPQQQQEQTQQQPQPSKSDREQNERYANLAKQAEQKALQKINNRQPRQRTLNKNW